MIICPNFNNPDVAREFNEIKEATTEKAAYAIWSLNNGNAIDRAPNGAPSILFQSLLDYYGGDRDKAIKAKSKVYKTSFLKWFGNWTGQEGIVPEYEEKEIAEVSKVVDENGEPLVVYHGTNIQNISIFDRTKIPEEQTLVGTGTATFGNFFSDKQDDAKSFADITRLRRKSGKATVYGTFLNIKNPMYFETLGDFRNYSHKEGHYNEDGDFVSDVKLPKEYDGVIVKRRNIKDETREFVAPNSNQIKSAIDNNGDFSTQSDDIHFHKDKLVKGTGNLLDEIQKEGATGVEAAENAVNFLKNKFPQLKINFVDDIEDIHRENSIEENTLKGLLYSNKSTKSLVYHGEVYLIRSRLSKQGGQIASEEILHMLIKTLQDYNPNLFNSLLRESRSKFKKLTAQIEDIYKDSSQDTIDNEIVTQSLARYVNRDIQSNKHGRFAELVEQFITWLKSILIKNSERIGDTVYVDPTQLKSLTLQELSDLINAEDTAFDVYTDHKGILYHNSNNSITQQMYDVNSQIETEREQYINSVLTQYIHNNPNAKQEDISRVQNSARQQFNIDKSNELLKQHQVRLAQTFGLALNRSGYYESQEQTQNKLLLEYMINSLQEDTFALYNADNINRTKYQQVGAVKNAASIGNLLYNALYEGDITTLDKAMARDYVRIFWGSDLIQSALDSLNNGTKTSEQLENELVERMTREPVESRDTSIIDWFNNIWTTLSNLVKQVFGVHNFTAQQQADILKAVDAAFMIAKDLEYTQANTRIYDREDGKFDSSTILSEKDKKVLSNIRHGLVTRIKSQMARTSKNQKLILDLKQRLEVIDARREDSIDDVFNIIEDFLINANTEIGRTRLYIDRTLLGPNYSMDNWDPQQINFIQQDLIGYYDNLLSIVSELFSDNMSVINKYDQQRSQTNPNAISISRFVAQLKSDVTSLKESYNKDIVLRYVKKLCADYVNEEDAITDKKTFVYNMNKWIEQDSAYGDLSAGEVLIGMASRSKSPIVRIVEKFASQADYATSRQVLKKGNELMRLYHKVRPTGSQISWNNWQKRFMEFDRDGIPTGYFVREINAGQFYKDKDAKEQELRIKYNLQADEDGNTIFPEEEFTKNDSVYNKYYDELDTWLDQHCERRYTLDYYKAKRRFLSPKTLQAQGSLQRQIDLIIDKARDKDGFVDMRKISANEKHQLEVLRKKKRDLGSHYIFTEAAGGVLRVEEKVGDALKIADEISAWNKFIADKVKYKPDWTAFNQAKQNLIDNGATADEIRQFERANTVDRITNEFYELLRKVTGKGVTNPEIESLQRRYSEILSALKDRQGAGSHNLNKLGLGLNTDMSGWKELHRIEQRISDIRKQLKLNGAKGVAGDTSQFTFDDLATNLYVTVSDGNPTTYLEYLTQMWRSAAASNTNLTQVFNDTFMVKDERGRHKYLKAFTYLTPRNYTLDINGQKINCIQSLPGSEYSELDESSPYVNQRFKKDGASMQPKDSYKNPKYAELTSDELDFLNKLKDTMREAYGMIPNRSTSIEDMLPQISGRTASVLANTLRAKEWSTALKYPFRDLGVSYSETDQDVSTNMDLARRPDGTVVNNIPIRFIRKLKNPSVQSTDVLGSVMMFYDMACNYKNKSQNLPTLELIKYAITPGMISTTNSMKDQYAKVENILDQRYYGKETSFGFDSNEKITEAKQRTIQTTKTIRNWSAVAMLGINFTTVEVGYIDACLSMFADAIGSKYFTTEDYKYALKECIMHTRKMLMGLGNAVVDDKLVAAMQYNQLSRSNAEIFSMTDKFKLDRFVKQHCLMGGYTMTDYMINSMMVMATYHHYRLIKDPKTGKEKFYSKTDAINEFTKLGYSEKEAVKLWKNSKTILWDAYELKDGLLVVKPGFKDKINKKLEDRIAGRLRDRTAMYNGVIPQTEKAKLQQNVFGSFITLMRNFYVNTYWDRFKTGGDYIKVQCLRISVEVCINLQEI